MRFHDFASSGPAGTGRGALCDQKPPKKLASLSDQKSEPSFKLPHVEGPGKLRRTPAAQQGSGEGATLQGGVWSHASAASATDIRVATPQVELELLLAAYSELQSPNPIRYALATRQALAELVGQGVNLEELKTVSPTGERLAQVAQEWLRQAHRRKLILRFAIPAQGPFVRSRCAFALMEAPTPRELALINATADGDSSIYIPSWMPRPEVEIIAKELLDSGWSQPEQAAEALTPERQLLRFSDPAEEAAWIVAAAKEEVIAGGVPPSQIAIVLSDADEYRSKIQLQAAACGLELARTDHALSRFRRRIQDLVEYALFGRVIGSPNATQHLHEVLGATFAPGDLDADSWIQLVFDVIQKLMFAATEVVSGENILLEQLIAALNSTYRDGAQHMRREVFFSTLPAIAATAELSGTTDGVAVIPVGFLPEGAYRTILLAGAGEGFLPTPLRDDATIPLTLRDRIAGLRSSRDLVARAWNRALSVIHAPSTRMVATFSSSLSEKPSWLLDRIELAATAPSKRFAVSNADFALLGSGPLRVAVSDGVNIERQRLFSPDFGPFLGDIGRPIELGKLSPTSINAIGQCGFKWLAQWGLRIGQRDPESFEPSPAAIGLVAHSVLEEVVKHGDLLDRAALAELIDSKGAALESAVSWPLLRRDLLEDLFAVTILDGFRRVGEVAVELNLEGTIEKFEVFGRLDRLDTVPGAGYRIIDYKYSSDAPKGIKDEEGRATVDVQLAIYSSLVEQKVGAVCEAQYLLVKARRFRTPKLQPESFIAALEQVRRAAAAGHLRVQPDIDQAACRWCVAALACRVGPHIAGKES